jgi:hypothetical protein
VPSGTSRGICAKPVWKPLSAVMGMRHRPCSVGDAVCQLALDMS